MSEQTAPRTGTHLHDLLGPWVPHQRWYPAKGREARTRELGRLLLPLAGTAGTTGAGGAGGAGGAPDPGAEAAGDVRVLVHVVEVAGAHDGDPVDVVQVPLVHRRAPRTDDAAAEALLGELRAPDGGSDGSDAWHVYDGPRDPAYTDALLALLAGRVRAVGLDDGGRRAEGAGSAAGDHPLGAVPPSPGSPARVLRGEQSNTSIIVEPAGAPPVIVKVFRVLHPGRNPDVEVQAALAGTGTAAVPALAGWVEGAWPGPDGALVRGDLAVASEFLAGAQDAWREASAAVAAGTSFADRAAALGAATAQVHAALAQHLPSRPATPQDADDLAARLRGRLEWALAAAAPLAERAGPLRALVGALGAQLLDAPLPALQRVHGDYHLGQVLDAPGRGWVLLDFEGEPLRPLAERTLPDLAVRDVAGMLRSFDYAAQQQVVGAPAGGGDAGAGDGAAAARAWAEQARDAFCGGYAAAAGEDPRERGALLDALELDKALYEVVYEVRNRPTWVGVPLAAVDRLLARD